MRLLPVLFVALFAAAAFAADRPRDLQPLPVTPPAPPGVAADADLEPQVTIVKKGKTRVEEYRVRGRLYMMKVYPVVGKPYWLIDHRGDGKLSRQDHLDNGVRPPQWVLFEF
jgi:hypothetical protein